MRDRCAMCRANDVRAVVYLPCGHGVCRSCSKGMVKCRWCHDGDWSHMTFQQYCLDAFRQLTMGQYVEWRQRMLDEQFSDCTPEEYMRSKDALQTIAARKRELRRDMEELQAQVLVQRDSLSPSAQALNELVNNLRAMSTKRPWHSEPESARHRHVPLPKLLDEFEADAVRAQEERENLALAKAAAKDHKARARAKKYEESLEFHERQDMQREDKYGLQRAPVPTYVPPVLNATSATPTPTDVDEDIRRQNLLARQEKLARKQRQQHTG